MLGFSAFSSAPLSSLPAGTIKYGIAAVNATSSVVANATRIQTANAVITATSSVTTATSGTLQIGFADVSATSSVTADATKKLIGLADVTSTSSVTAVGLLTLGGNAVINSTSSVTAIVSSIITANAVITCTSNVTASTGSVLYGFADIAFTADYVASGYWLDGYVSGSYPILNAKAGYMYVGQATITATSDLTVRPYRYTFANAVINVLSSVVVDAGAIRFGTGSIDSTSSVTALPNKVLLGNAVIASTADYVTSGYWLDGYTADAQPVVYANAIRIRTYEALIDATSSVTASPIARYAGFGAISATADIRAYANYIAQNYPNIVAPSVVTADGHPLGYNWSDVAVGNNTWTNTVVNANTWVDVAPSTNTWTDVEVNANTWTEVSTSSNSWLRQG